MQGGAMANDPCSIADFIRPGWPQAMKTLRAPQFVGWRPRGQGEAWRERVRIEH
jgi:hypothetical protein